MKPISHQDPWKWLAIYESVDLVQRRLEKRHGKSPSREKATEVAAHIAQGRQYFSAAGDAPHLIRPLLLYYGVLSLSRSVVLCSKVSDRESTLSEAHGLSASDWRQSFSKGLTEIPNLVLESRKGTFKELISATKNIERIVVHDFEKRRYPMSHPGSLVLAAGYRFTLGQILARLPDLNSLYVVTFDCLAACHPAYVRILPEVQFDFYLLESLGHLISVEQLRSAFGLHDDVRVELSDYHYPVGYINSIYFNTNKNVSPPTMRSYFPPVKSDSAGVSYLVEPLPDDVNLSTLSLLFAVSYALGMLVRYFPSRWASLQGKAKGDTMLPLMNAATELIERRYPALVLQELEGDSASAETLPGG